MPAFAPVLIPLLFPGSEDGDGLGGSVVAGALVGVGVPVGNVDCEAEDSIDEVVGLGDTHGGLDPNGGPPPAGVARNDSECAISEPRDSLMKNVSACSSRWGRTKTCLP